MKQFLVALLAILLLSPVVVTAKSDNANSGSGNGGGHGNVTIGNLQSVTSSEIVVNNEKEGTTSGKIDKNTKVLGKGNSNKPLSILRKNGLVAIISTDSGQLASQSGSPKKVVKIFFEDASASASQSKRQAVQGVIMAINGSTLTLAHQIHRDRQWTITVTPTTIIKMKDVASPTLSSLQVGMRIVAIGDNSTGGITAVRIQVIPGKATGIFNRQPVSSNSASGSGTPSSSASASPTASASATPTSSPLPIQTPEASPSATP